MLAMLHGFLGGGGGGGGGEYCKLQASFFSINLRHFQAFKLQNSAAPGGSTPDPLEILIAITNCTLHEPHSKFHVVSPVRQVYNYQPIIHI